jgi:agmatine deiminase
MSENYYRQPAEWAPHRAVWTAWPSHGELWEDNLEPAQDEFVALCKSIAAVDAVTGESKGEKLEILVPNSEQKSLAEQKLKGLTVRFHEIPFGDIWLRDTAPIFVKSLQGNLAAANFIFNGWGNKYSLPYDTEVASNVSQAAGLKKVIHHWVLEGGSIEVDGTGLGLTTEQCLLNPNRNPSLDKKQIEDRLKESLGLTKIIWLTEGLLNDHTDGHIDTIARFVGPGKVVCMTTSDQKDPNFPMLEKIYEELKKATDQHGKPLEIVRIPSPGMVEDEEGELMPASYVNFYIGNASVVVPTYGTSNDDVAVQAIAQLFPEKKTYGCSAYAILSGGGAFHCITQQEPL